MGIYEWLWIAGFVLFLIIEAITFEFISIWFAGGSIFAIIMAKAGGSFFWQFLVFVLVSVFLLLVSRPLAKKFLKLNKVKTNVDKLIGEIAIVEEDINNDKMTGKVNYNGMTWTARSLDGHIITVGKKVEIVKIEGVKLIVKDI